MIYEWWWQSNRYTAFGKSSSWAVLVNFMKPKVYSKYIRSKEWLGKHSNWLKSFNSCAAFPFLHLGKSSRGYHRYNMHHTHYKTLGHERLWWDVVPLSIFAHQHIVHGVLSLYKRPSQQKVYPNLCQRLFHAWCRSMILLVWFWWLILPVTLMLAWKANQSGVLGFLK